MTPGRPSATALLVATSVVREGAAHALPPIAIELAQRAVEAASGSCLAALARSRPGRWLLAVAERAVLPGLASHHCARKAWLWSRLQRSPVVEGPVIWVGTGFDGLGRALLGHAPHATVIETDHPATLRQRGALSGDAAIAAVPLVLPQQLDALVALCAARPATLVCESVLMYLPVRDVMRLLRRLAALPSPPRLIFSALDTLQPGGRGFRRPARMVQRWLDRQGETFRWRGRPGRVVRCLADAGYAVTARWDGRGFGEYAIEAESTLGRQTASNQALSGRWAACGAYGGRRWIAAADARPPGPDPTPPHRRLREARPDRGQ